MSQTTFQTEVNDYLDLFLYAKSLGDQDWQETIKKHLADLYKEEQAAKPTNLLQKYKLLSDELTALYKKLHEPSPDHALFEKMWELKKEQTEIRRKLKKVFDPLS